MIPDKRNDWHSKEYRLKFPKFWRKTVQRRIRNIKLDEDIPNGSTYKKMFSDVYYDYDPYW
jgi:hypothetical protein